jgi:hypothetical protein
MFTNSEMAKCLDEIFLDALKADESIMQLTEGRIYSTCVDIPPMDDDNTPLPYIIIRGNAARYGHLFEDDWICKSSIGSADRFLQIRQIRGPGTK